MDSRQTIVIFMDDFTIKPFKVSGWVGAIFGVRKPIYLKTIILNTFLVKTLQFGKNNYF